MGLTISLNRVSFLPPPVRNNIFYEIRVITNYRTPNNLTKGKSKPITIQTDKISQQPENCENRNDSDLVQAFLNKWWVESDFKAPNLPLSLRFKGSGCHHNSIQLQEQNRQNSCQSSTTPGDANVKNTLTSHTDKKTFLTPSSTSLSPYTPTI